MPPSPFRPLLWITLTLLLAAPAWGAQKALIVIGTTGSSSIGSDLMATARTIRDGLVARGFASGDIEILSSDSAGQKITRDLVLQHLKAEQGLAASDEFWLVLLGFSAPSADGPIAFQVTGPRLEAGDLKAALDQIPARQFVFVGTSASGGFIPILLKANREVLAATTAEGEIDLPRFPDNWATALKNAPHASWKQIAAAAAAATTKGYESSGITLAEHAQMGDPVTGKTLDAPFGANTEAAPEQKPQADGSMALINASDIKVEIHQPNSEWENQPATPETKKLIAEARAAPNPEGFNAILLEQRLGYTVRDDRTSETFALQRVYIAREDGVLRWANYMLPQDPPAVTTQLIAARLIQPDGSATVFNPAKLPPQADLSSGTEETYTPVFIPGARAGCLVEIAYRTQRLLDATMPNYSEELPIQQEIPALLTEVQLQIPAQSPVHFKLRNTDAQPTVTEANGVRKFSWKIDNLPGFEPLPYDPPERDLQAALDISSLSSWDEFVSWYNRLAQGSDAQDAAVKAKAQELAATAKTRLEKIRKAYEFVSALRYVAIEFGIDGIRPRTPATVLQNRYGDCKDKANLLIALLRDMGVDARFCVLNRGSSTDTSFPSWQFNHAIAYVPQSAADGQPSDLWLDTTDSTAPFPTLSPGDVGRQALVFTNQSGKFLTVVAAGEEGAAVDDHWQLKQKEDGTWNGTIESTRGGLADYELRQTVRGLTPQQRDYQLQGLLTRELPDADFSQLSLTAADDLSRPLKLTAELELASGLLPGPALDVEEMFAPPKRDRPMLLNNGQQLHQRQTVDIVYHAGAPAEAPPPFQGEAGGVRVSATWQRVDDHTFHRTAELMVTNPLIASSDYSAVRQLMRQWRDHLIHSL